MLLTILNEIDRALSCEMYVSALNLVLTVPDICGKAEYPQLCVGKRYIAWFDEWIGQYEKSALKEGEVRTPYLSGEMVYRLRCNVLHQGNINIDKGEIKDTDNQINRFILLVQKKNEFGIYPSISSAEQDGISSEIIGRTYELNLQNLCMKICEAARHYYEQNKEKFNFFNYEIVDWDKTTAQFNK